MQSDNVKEVVNSSILESGESIKEKDIVKDVFLREPSEEDLLELAVTYVDLKKILLHL